MFSRKNKDPDARKFTVRGLFSRRGRASAVEAEVSRLAVETVENIDFGDIGLEDAVTVDATDVSAVTVSEDTVVVAETETVEVLVDGTAAAETVVEAEPVAETPETVEFAAVQDAEPVDVEAEPVVAAVEAVEDDVPAADRDLPAERKPTVPAFRADNEKRHRFGEYVYRKGLISKDALYAASLEQAVTGAKIGQILVANGFLTDKDRVEAILATEHSRIAQEKVTRCRIPVDILSEYNIMISAEQDDRIYVATCESERSVRLIVAEYYPNKHIEFVAFDASAMNVFLSSMRKMSSIDDPANLEELMLDRIVYNALGEGASDIHIIPRATSYSVFYRKDGVRRLIHTGNLTEYQVLIAKIKDKAAMDLAERRKPQDGGFQMEYASKMIDLRIATIPVVDGHEICIVRLLDSDRVQPSLEKLGISEVTKWRKGIRHQFGLCLICGPTGSGKTTTLNASVREMDRFGKAIYSIEDPVEYRIPFVAQVAVNKQVDLDFANAIRAFMRADPDVMIVGEVRDRETAANALKAAETGHLVIATLHTGSIVGAITRLKELGIEPYELRYLVRAIMVQTLIRTLCKTCGGREPERHECHECNGSGYRGRTVVSECEYFEGPDDVQKIIPEANKHIEETWVPKEKDAVEKMYAGLTDFAELDRVFGPSIERFLRKEGEPQP